MASKPSELSARVKSLESTMVSLRSHKRLRICSGRSSVLDPLPSFCDKGTAPPNSTHTKPDIVHPMPSNDVNQPEGYMTATRGSPEKITMLKEPAAAERILLGLLGPDDTRIMQAYADGGLRQNLAHHALAACLHFAMWLRENGESSCASRERGEAIDCVAELEETVRNFEVPYAKWPAEIITMLKEPAAAERALLSLLGPEDTRIMQAYADGGLRQNLAHHALSACLHFAMWLKENGDSSWEIDEAISRVAELEETVRKFEETIAKKGATEILRHQVQEYTGMEKEYESKLNGVLNDAGQQGQKAKELEALHQEKVTCLDEVLRQLEEAKADLAKVTHGRDIAMTRVRQLTGALTWARQLYEQAEVEMKQVQEDCEMYRVLWDMEKEEHAKERIALIAKLELKEDLQSQKQKQKKEDRVMLTPELIEALSFFWTICNQCNTHYQFFRIYLNRSVHCPNCKKNFMAIEKAPPPCSSTSRQQHQNARLEIFDKAVGTLKKEIEMGMLGLSEKKQQEMLALITELRGATPSH